MNSRRMNRLEELGRVDAEKAFTKKGARNLKDEKKRIVRELKKAKGGLIEPKEHKKRRKEMKARKKSDLKTDKAMVRGFRQSKYGKAGRIAPMKGERLKEGFAPGKKLVLRSERIKKADGGSLKKVQPHQKGLKKLPTKVRNKMGYMKKGGKVGMGKAMRGGGCVR